MYFEDYRPRQLDVQRQQRNEYAAHRHHGHEPGRGRRTDRRMAGRIVEGSLEGLQPVNSSVWNDWKYFLPVSTSYEKNEYQ